MTEPEPLQADATAPPAKRKRGRPRKQPAEAGPILHINPSLDGPADLPWYTGADLPEQALHWMWPEYFPGGVPMLLYGPSQRGKSTLARALAAAVTCGFGPPGWKKSPPANVLWFAAEEHYRSVVRPRLSAAGADLARVHFPEELRDGSRRRITVLEHGRQLQAAVDRTRAALIVFDPITSFVGGEAPPFSNDAAVACMTALTDLGTLTNCAVLGIMQPKKGGRGAADEQISGGMEWFNRARMVYLNSPHPDKRGTAFFIVQKTSLGEPPPSLTWALSKRDGLPLLTWGGTCDVTADTAMHGGEAPEEVVVAQDVVTFLKARLREGPEKVKDLQRWGAEAGFSPYQLQRAKVRLGITFRQHGNNDDKDFWWFKPEKGWPS